MTLPTYGDVSLALLLELVRCGKPVKPLDSYDLVARNFPALTASDRALTNRSGSGKVFADMVNFARNRLRVRGVLENGLPAGSWCTTQEARGTLVDDLVARGVTLSRAMGFIDASETLGALLGRDWATERRQSAIPLKAGVSDGGEATTASSAQRGEREVAAADEHRIAQAVLARLNAMKGDEFEDFVGKVLDALGLCDTQVVGRSGDEGVDILTYLSSPIVRAKVAVQVKRHTANVGPRDISYLRDRWARRADRLLFITTSDFTSGAREVAADDHEQQVALVTGAQLVDVMLEHGLGVVARPQVTYELDETYFSG